MAVDPDTGHTVLFGGLPWCGIAAVRRMWGFIGAGTIVSTIESCSQGWPLVVVAAPQPLLANICVCIVCAPPCIYVYT